MPELRNQQPWLLALLLSWALLSVSLPAQAGSDEQWQVISLLPANGVYQADTLQQLVRASESLWQLKTPQQQPLIRQLDSLASMNVIVAQQQDIRFRRLIEQRELSQAGLKRLARLVEQHPLLQRRLVSADGQATHLWLRLSDDAPSDSLQRLTDQLQQQLALAGQPCIQQAVQQGPLYGQQMSRWHYQLTAASRQQADGRRALQQLARAQQQLSQSDAAPAALDGRLYSAVDLLRYLGNLLGDQLLDEQGLPRDNNTLAQMYMMAESLRSRDLHSLARPDFRQLQLVAIGHRQPLAAPSLDHYQLIHTSHWQADTQSYRVLDCRSPALISAETSL